MSDDLINKLITVSEEADISNNHLNFQKRNKSDNRILDKMGSLGEYIDYNPRELHDSHRRRETHQNHNSDHYNRNRNNSDRSVSYNPSHFSNGKGGGNDDKPCCRQSKDHRGGGKRKGNRDNGGNNRGNGQNNNNGNERYNNRRPGPGRGDPDDNGDDDEDEENYSADVSGIFNIRNALDPIHAIIIQMLRNNTQAVKNMKSKSEPYKGIKSAGTWPVLGLC